MSASQNSQHKDEVYILRCEFGQEETQRICIGHLHEKRSNDGELIEMFIEPFQGEQDNLVGDNLQYVKKIASERYRFSNFQMYPDCEEIVVEPDDSRNDQRVLELKATLKEAEETIRLVRERKPIQKIDRRGTTSGPKIQNLTKPLRSLPFGFRPHWK
ncbi:hypothetical protein [Bradyrhizobium sp. ARR65]|uniref:hypothetical protein n=1 Tax=Bradyrhizobium sp. ARR65 TaxID=1040989 RepID=UPI000A46C92D|nr:hypothetical protein [Bradyrhizobium sp. ARR65]